MADYKEYWGPTREQKLQAENQRLRDELLKKNEKEELDKLKARGYQKPEPVSEFHRDQLWECMRCASVITNPDKHDRVCPKKEDR